MTEQEKERYTPTERDLDFFEYAFALGTHPAVITLNNNRRYFGCFVRYPLFGIYDYEIKLINNNSDEETIKFHTSEIINIEKHCLIVE